MVAQSNGGRAVKAFVHEPEVRSREQHQSRIFAKMLREGLRQASDIFTGRGAATGSFAAAKFVAKTRWDPSFEGVQSSAVQNSSAAHFASQ